LIYPKIVFTRGANFPIHSKKQLPLRF